MIDRLLLVLAFQLVAFSGFAVGQIQREPLPSGVVLSVGFQADEPLPAVMEPGRQSLTGRLVVNVNGRWAEARSRIGVPPAR